MKIKTLIYLIVVSIFISSCRLRQHSSPLKSDANISIKTRINSANCGPKVLLEVCKIYNIPATEEELTKFSDTINGESSFFGLSQAAKSKGLGCVGAKVSFDKLKTLAKDNQIIAHFSENHHFILIKEIDDKTITIYDPALTHMPSPQIPIHLFLSDWDGNVLIINNKKGG